MKWLGSRFKSNKKKCFMVLLWNSLMQDFVGPEYKGLKKKRQIHVKKKGGGGEMCGY